MLDLDFFTISRFAQSIAPLEKTLPYHPKRLAIMPIEFGGNVSDYLANCLVILLSASTFKGREKSLVVHVEV